MADTLIAGFMIPQAGCPYVGQAQAHELHPGLPSRGGSSGHRYRPADRCRGSGSRCRRAAAGPVGRDRTVAGGQPAWGVGCRRACRAGTAASRERRTAHGSGVPERSGVLLRHRESEPVETYLVIDTEKVTHEIIRMAALLG